MGGVRVLRALHGSRMWRWLVPAASVLVLALAGMAAAEPGPAALSAEVSEWSIVPSTGVVAAGRVRVIVRNSGSQTHALSIVRTPRVAEALPLHGALERGRTKQTIEPRG
jgi:hypothetical protein